MWHGRAYERRPAPAAIGEQSLSMRAESMCCMSEVPGVWYFQAGFPNLPVRCLSWSVTTAT